MGRQFPMLESLTPTTFDGLAWRFTRPKYATTEDFISGMGSFRSGARFNAPNSFPALYLGLEEETALAELKNGMKKIGLVPFNLRTQVFAAVKVSVSRLLDLRQLSNCQQLDLSLADLHCDWVQAQCRGLEAITQQLGRAAHDAGFEGILTPSARNAGGSNLIVFPKRPLPTSSLTPGELPFIG